MTANPPAGSGLGAHLTNAGAPVNGTDEIQVLTVTGSPTGGTFTIGFGSFVTAAIDHDAAASAVQTALRAIASIGSTGCSVAGSAGGPWTVTFDGDHLQKKAVPQMTLVTNSLTGGSTPTVTPTTTTPGVTATHREAPTSALLLDTTNGAEYINTGAPGAPVWNDVGATAAGEIALAENQILVGTAGNVAAAKAVSGDLTAVASGAFTVGADKITEQKMLITQIIPVPIQAVLGNRAGSQSDGVMVGRITQSDLADCRQEDNSDGPSYIDETADSASAGANDVEVPDPFDTDDALYCGYATKFFGMFVTIGTQGVGDAVEAETVWEYYNGSSWASLTEVTDDTVAFSGTAAIHLVTFLPPTDWAAVVVDVGPSSFHVRLRATADNVYNTTQMKITKIQALPLIAGQGVPIPFDCVISDVDMAALVASGTADDTELLLVNVTAGTFAQITWTGGDVIDTQTGLAIVFSADDEYVIVVLQEDGSTEFDGATLNLMAVVG